MFVYANALHAVISSRERRATARSRQPAADIYRASLAIGPCPILETIGVRAPSGNGASPRVNHAYENGVTKKSHFYAHNVAMQFGFSETQRLVIFIPVII